MRALAPNGVAMIPYGRSFLASLSDITVAALLIGAMASAGPKSLANLSGLTAQFIRPFIVYGLIFGAVGLISVMVAPIAKDLSIADIFWLGIGGPVSEEIVYRGFAIGALMRLAGWRFMPAALAPAIIFGLAHAAQGSSIGESAGIAAITGVGGVLFGWLFVRWGFNLWPAIFTHVGLNTVWVVFALGDTAIGGWFGNALRLLVICVVVATAIWLSPQGRSNQPKR